MSLYLRGKTSNNATSLGALQDPQRGGGEGVREARREPPHAV